MWYKTFLPKLHDIIKPRRYAEIGIRHGYSLSLAKDAKKVAIDPSFAAPDMQFDVGPTSFFKVTSDDFFAKHDLQQELGGAYDLGYIDGLHLFEFALRDLINMEKAASPSSVIIVDDVIPRNPGEASRKSTGGSWVGDVWKLIPCIVEYRPDLAARMMLARSEPTGCLILTNPDPSSRVLSDRYQEILGKFLSESYPTMPGKEVLDLSVAPEEALQRLSTMYR